MPIQTKKKRLPPPAPPALMLTPSGDASSASIRIDGIVPGEAGTVTTRAHRTDDGTRIVNAAAPFGTADTFVVLDNLVVPADVQIAFDAITDAGNRGLGSFTWTNP